MPETFIWFNVTYIPYEMCEERVEERARSASHFLFLAGAKATKWLAQADKLACKPI